MARDIYIKEDGEGGTPPANNVGAGNIKGTGGKGGEPGVNPGYVPPMLRRGKFAGKETFLVNSNTFQKGRLSKKKGQHWKKYFEEDESFREIREYANKNPKKSIILQDENTGALYVARYGSQI